MSSERDPADAGASDASVSPETDGGTVDDNPLETLLESAEAGDEVADRNRMGQFYRQYVYAPLSVLVRDWRAVVGSGIILFYFLVGIFGPFVVEPTSASEGPRFLQPFQNWAFPLGTDDIGQDLLALHIYSTLPLLKMMAAGGAFTASMGIAFGVVAGYKGGTIDIILNTVTDVFINLPGLPLVIVLAAIVQPSNPFVLGVLLSAASWAGLARAIRSQVLQLRHESFIEASRTMGITQPRILIKDIIPHLMPYVTVNLVQAMRSVLFSAVGLYFIGVLPYDSANWGTILNNAYTSNAHLRPNIVHWLVIPTVVIVVFSMGMILISQSLDRVFNPRVRAKHEQNVDEDPTEDVDRGEAGSSWIG